MGYQQRGDKCNSDAPFILKVDTAKVCLAVGKSTNDTLEVPQVETGGRNFLAQPESLSQEDTSYLQDF
jgi:hypothetical protein